MNLNKGCIEIVSIKKGSCSVNTMNLNKGCIEIKTDTFQIKITWKDEP